MVLGVTLMKALYLLPLFVFCQNIQANSQLIIFNTQIKITDNCQIEFNNENMISTHKPAFSKIGKCRIITHSRTNVEHIIYVNGMYIVLIENNIEENNRCTSEYTAVGVNKSNEVFITERINNSGSCNQGKDPSALASFSVKLKPLINTPGK